MTPWSFTILQILILSFFSWSVMAKEKAVYGDDNRLEYFQVADAKLQSLFAATAVQIRRDHFSFSDLGVMLNYHQTVGEENSLCADQPYVNQPNPGECSGFLIAPDLLVTAGHCVRDDEECRQYKWLFDFYYSNEYQDLSIFLPQSLHSCSEIVAQEFESGKRDDYAIIRLSPKVTDRAPLRWRTAGEISLGEGVFAIGYPLGIPAKMTGIAQVQKNGSRYFFTANLDTFVVNSGSAVFNAQTLDLEGILVRGGEDFKFDYQAQCNRYYHYPESEGQEDVMRITRLPLNEL